MVATAHQQAPVGDAADDCRFARPDLAELTIELATLEVRADGGTLALIAGSSLARDFRCRPGR